MRREVRKPYWTGILPLVVGESPVSDSALTFTWRNLYFDRSNPLCSYGEQPAPILDHDKAKKRMDLSTIHTDRAKCTI